MVTGSETEETLSLLNRGTSDPDGTTKGSPFHRDQTLFSVFQLDHEPQRKGIPIIKNVI